MAETYKKISDFNVASSFGDNDLLLVSQSGTTKVIKGSTLKALAKAAGIEAAKINNAAVNASGHLILTTTDGVAIDTGKVTGADGVSVTGAAIDAQYHLILTFSDGSTKDAGYCRGASGAGTGDMLESDYDSSSAVKAAGGISAYALPKSFDATLTVNGWSSKQQTVTNALFVTSGYKYIVGPAYASADAYNKAKIKAKDVTTNGQMVFTCENVPTAALTVQILRVRVQ
nr:MAG TPA: hypothetical protein [Caudoviricetes sp.]